MHATTSGFDRNRLMIGTYCVNDYAWSEGHVRLLKHAGIDFLCATPADPELLERLARHGMGVLASEVLPHWWGGDGENAGKMAQSVPVSEYERAAADFRDHPAVWGLDMGDEPSALDFAHYGELICAVRRLFPGKLPYLNLYPNYASVPENTAAESVSQLGTPTYQQYIDRFVECVDCDYICYDHYMYALTVAGAYENLRVVANKCRECGRDLWIVLQVNSNRPEEWMSLAQLRHQAYTAMAFGARSICWACWTAGWWHNQVLDGKGEPTRQYQRLSAVNRELKALGDSYMRYRNVSTHFVGEIGAPDFAGMVGQGSETSLDAGMFCGVAVEPGCGAVIGHMTALKGGEALMVADATDPLCAGAAERTYELRFSVRPGARVRALMNGLPVPCAELGEGSYSVRVEMNAGLLITAD